MIALTAVGADKPGMAYAVTAELARVGCNIEDTTMTRLSGEFAMILIVSPPHDVTTESLLTRLAPLEQSHGLFINGHEIAPGENALQEDAERYIVAVYAPENRGLVARMTQVFAENGVNISDVQTRVASRGALYVMLFEIELPQELELVSLTVELENAAAEIGAQISVNPIEEESL